jgi:protein-disulfide isomerase
MKTGSLIAALAVATGTALSSTAAAQTQNVAELRAAMTKGSANAPVTIYEISDFQCPWCGRFAREVMPLLEREYIATGKVRFVFVNLPLPNHANAVPAAELAMCAARQNRFWPVHDRLFQTQERWSRMNEPGAFFLSLVDSAGANRDQVVECLRSGAMRPLIESDARGAVRSGARSTPSFYIEGGLLAGFVPFEDMRPILDSIVAARQAARPRP